MYVRGQEVSTKCRQKGKVYFMMLQDLNQTRTKDFIHCFSKRPNASTLYRKWGFLSRGNFIDSVNYTADCDYIVIISTNDLK